jgi:hypothetical protein
MPGQGVAWHDTLAGTSSISSGFRGSLSQQQYDSPTQQGHTIWSPYLYERGREGCRDERGRGSRLHDNARLSPRHEQAGRRGERLVDCDRAVGRI